MIRGNPDTSQLADAIMRASRENRPLCVLMKDARSAHRFNRWKHEITAHPVRAICLYDVLHRNVLHGFGGYLCTQKGTFDMIEDRRKILMEVYGEVQD